MKKVLLETLVVTVVGISIALAANALSPLGLVLTRNYFPGANNGQVSMPIIVMTLPDGAGTNQPTSAELLAARLREKNLRQIDRERAAQLFDDPRFKMRMVIFVDARDGEHYRQGHVPGAYEFDPYRSERYLATVLPVCQAAEEIVVYCSGGECEDSQFAAVALRDAGVSNQKLWVYGGGFAEWATNGLPVEIGERDSGDLRPPVR